MSYTTPLQAFTIDVEDYFHVSAFAGQISRDDWHHYPLRVADNTARLLDLLARHNASATFFVLGWVAEQTPATIKAIAAAGHEVASHGYSHTRATLQTPDEFRADVQRSLDVLQDQTGTAIAGYRAPSFSIDPTNEWAFQILAELGFRYSSSTYPVEHDLYGTPDWPKAPYRRPEGIVEIPIPTLTLHGRNWPIGGGGYFRLYPYFWSRYLIRSYLRTSGRAYSFYTHPWEIDADQPRISGAPLKSRIRHYLNLGRMPNRLNRLLRDFEWGSMQQVYQEHIG
jgi:polysaccharide deacetylase family protein (PEP-CTERM system associated)